ncbi:MAG: hypothetical protein HY283_02645 [Nitrospirae bacterium]|nr:hypothetical protein [Nitrospirota bacterium]
MPFNIRILFIFVILNLLFMNAAQSHAGKPRGPLDLAMSTDASPAPGAVVGVTFTVTSRMDVPLLAVSVELPEGLPHVDGPLHWTGPAAKDQPIVLTFHVGPLGAQSYDVIGRATVSLPNGSTWTQAASILLEPVKHEKPNKPLPRLRQDPQGQSIIEIPVE